MIRLSYTMLRNWELNNIDEVVNNYAGIYSDINTDAVIQGSAWDQIVADTVKDTGKLPKEFNSFEVGDAFIQPKHELDINEDFQLVVVPDLITPDMSTLIEIKTGRYSSSDYSRTMQVPIYLFAIDQARRAIVIHYDQYTNETDWYLIHATDKIKQRAKEYITKGGAEIKDYLISQGLYE